MSWRTTMGFTETQPLSRADLDQAYRTRARTAHPDAGGDRAAWDKLTAAYEAGKASLS